MTRLRTVLLATMLLGVVAGVTASSSVGVSPASSDATLPLTILVNRLELTPDQMLKVYDLLSDLLAQVDELEARRTAFEEEMILFDGSQEALDEALVAFREEMAGGQQLLREATQSAVEQLKDTLTIRQGEIIGAFLRTHLGGVLGSGSTAMPMPASSQRMGSRQRMVAMRSLMVDRVREAMDASDHAGSEAGPRGFFYWENSEGRHIQPLFGEPGEGYGEEPMTTDRERLGARAESLRGRLTELGEQVRTRLGERLAASPQGPSAPSQYPGLATGAQVQQRVVELLRELLDILGSKLQIT